RRAARSRRGSSRPGPSGRPGGSGGGGAYPRRARGGARRGGRRPGRARGRRGTAPRARAPGRRGRRGGAGGRRGGGAGAGGRGGDRGAGAGGEVGERSGRGGDDRAVLDRPGDAQVRVARAVEGPEVAADVVDREPLDVGARADDALAERVVLEQKATGDVVGVDLDALLVVVLVDLLEHQLALELDVGEPRPGQELAEHVERRRDQLG